MDCDSRRCNQAGDPAEQPVFVVDELFRMPLQRKRRCAHDGVVMTESNAVPIEALLAESDWVRRLAESLVHDKTVADDIVQQTWLAALKRPPATDRPLRPWLRTVVENFVKMRGRGEAARTSREQAASRPEGIDSSEGLVARVETQRMLGGLVLELEEPFRTTVILRYYEGLSSAEIARRTGAPEGTVRWRLKRGLEMMRERLPAIGFGPGATDFVARMIRYHLRPGELIRNWPVSDKAVRKFVADLDGHVLPLMLVNLVDGMATNAETKAPNLNRAPGRLRPDWTRRWIANPPAMNPATAMTKNFGDAPRSDGRWHYMKDLPELGGISADHVEVNQGGAQRIEGRDITINQGGAAIIRGDTVRVEQGGAAIIAARRVDVRDGGAFIILARRVSGNVNAALDWRGIVAIFAGIIAIMVVRGRR